MTNINDMESLVDGALDVEGEASVDFGGDLARDDLENLFAEFDEETVEGRVDLLIYVFALRDESVRG